MYTACGLFLPWKLEEIETREGCFSSHAQHLSLSHLPSLRPAFALAVVSDLLKRPADHSLATPTGMASSQGRLRTAVIGFLFNCLWQIQEILIIVKLKFKAQGFYFCLGLSVLQSISSPATLTNSCYMTRDLIIWSQIGVKTIYYLPTNFHRQY